MVGRGADALLRAGSIFSAGTSLVVAAAAGALLGPGCVALAAPGRMGTIGLAIANTVLLLSRIRPAVVAVAVPAAVPAVAISVAVSTTITA